MRDFSKFSHRPTKGINTSKAMQLSDILSAASISSVYNATKDNKSYADTYAPNVSKSVVDSVNEFAADQKCKLDENFWKRFGSQWFWDNSVIVCIDGKNAKILNVTEGVTFAKHICQLLKAGNRICWFRGNAAYDITWEYWKRIYTRLVGNVSLSDLPEPPSKRELRERRVNRKREKMFYETAEVIRSKKLSKRGYNMTFDEVRAMRRHEEYEKYLRSTSKEARKIMQVL